MGSSGVENPERRWFLCAAPMAAMVGLAIADGAICSRPAEAQSGNGDAGRAFEVFGLQELVEDVKVLQADPGNKTLYECPTFSLVLTTESAKSGKEFEWHEHRDHVFHILDGETTYELGGTPKGAHSPRPGEWLAPDSEGATTVDLKRGDVLVVRRGTPHKRITRESVTFSLLAPVTT